MKTAGPFSAIKDAPPTGRLSGLATLTEMHGVFALQVQVRALPAEKPVAQGSQVNYPSRYLQNIQAFANTTTFHLSCSWQPTPLVIGGQKNGVCASEPTAGSILRAPKSRIVGLHNYHGGIKSY